MTTPELSLFVKKTTRRAQRLEQFQFAAFHYSKVNRARLGGADNCRRIKSKRRAQPISVRPHSRSGTVFEVLFRRVDRLIARRTEFAVHSGMSGGPAPSGIVQSIRAAMRAFGRIDASVGIGVQVTVCAGVRAG
jgi:hypothetical protein